jgi:hypothetical protein
MNKSAQSVHKYSDGMPHNKYQCGNYRPQITLSGLIPAARLLNTLANILPDNPSANKRTYDNTSPSKPVTIL